MTIQINLSGHMYIDHSMAKKQTLIACNKRQDSIMHCILLHCKLNITIILPSFSAEGDISETVNSVIERK